MLESNELGAQRRRRLSSDNRIE